MISTWEPDWAARFDATQATRMKDTGWRDPLMLRVSDRHGSVWDRSLAREGATTPPALPERTPFRIASVTKVHVAAALVRLVEKHSLQLASPLAAWLTPPTLEALTGGGYDPTHITIDQLMRHTSGLRDHCSCDAFLDRLRREPVHRWSRLEQLQIAMSLGAPLCTPGGTFHYSDTGYILLGEVLEQACGLSLAAALRSLLSYERLGLHHTWLDGVESAPSGLLACAPQFLDDLDAGAFDASFDLFGGGGLVSTLADIDRYFRALFDGRVFAQNDTLGRLLDAERTPCGFDGFSHNGLMFHRSIAGWDCWGHTGFWGVLAACVPECGLVLSATFNRSRQDGAYGPDELLEDFAASLHRP